MGGTRAWREVARYALLRLANFLRAKNLEISSMDRRRQSALPSPKKGELTPPTDISECILRWLVSATQ